MCCLLCIVRCLLLLCVIVGTTLVCAGGLSVVVCG